MSNEKNWPDKIHAYQEDDDYGSCGYGWMTSPGQSVETVEYMLTSALEAQDISVLDALAYASDSLPLLRTTLTECLREAINILEARHPDGLAPLSELPK